MAQIVSATPDHLEAAAQRLHAGELVAFPTETVYGLGADATNPLAIAKVFALKGRPADHPLIVHIGNSQMLAHWAAEVPPPAQALADAFWPGPLTLIVPRADWVPAAVAGGQDSIGLRCPAHPVAMALLAALGRLQLHPGIAAPSANLFGHVSPTCAAHVADDFADRALWIIDGGATQVGIESTIVDCSRWHQGGGVALLRPGAIGQTAIEAVLGMPIRAGAAEAPRVSGSLASHYAPRKPLRLASAAEIALVSAAQAPDIALLAFACHLDRQWGWHHTAAPNDPAAYAQHLYAWLRAMDSSAARSLLIEAVPTEPSWLAIADRLSRAAHREVT